MAEDQYHRRQDDELFMPQATTTPDSPTIGPLRITKTSSPPSASKPAASRDPYAQSSRLGNASQQYQQPPYPDDRPRVSSRQGTPSGERPRTASSSDEAPGRRAGTPQSRFKFTADDPNRPSLSAFSHPQVRQAAKPTEPRKETTKPLPDSPGPETPDKDIDGPAYPHTDRDSSQSPIPFLDYGSNSDLVDDHPGPVDTTASQLYVPEPQSINRLGSTASVSTTRAFRGSPPPPDTPLAGRSSANRWAATSPPTTSNIHAQGAAATQRASPYTPAASRPAQPSPNQQNQQQTPPMQQRRWSPTEQPDDPHGPTAVYQGSSEVPLGTSAPSPQTVRAAQQATALQLEGQQPARYLTGQSMLTGQDFNRLNISEEPPPAYSSVSQPGQKATPGATAAQAYANDKRTSFAGQVPLGVRAQPISAQDPNMARHPAFANESQPTQIMTPTHPAAAGLTPIEVGQQPVQQQATGPSLGSPPPLPEGWIAHLDQNSGHYYYIHLPTQSTQWEFPKGPTPLNLQEPMSPTGTVTQSITSPVYGSFQQPMMSPGVQSPGYPTAQYATYRDSMASMASVASPTATAFTGPPPSAGVDMYKVAPTNGVYFGPLLRYTNIDLERSLWLGSILLITDVPHPPTIHIHQSVDLSPNPRQLKANPIYSHQRWLFYRYDIDVLMDEHPTKWTYAVTSHLGCTRFEFLVAGRYETSWRFITHSGNDFALSVNANERAKIGGVNLMWKDVLQKHQECGGFHAQLGLGGQIYADRLWQDVPAMRQWTTMSGKENRKNAPWTAKLEEDVIHAYFHYYTSHFDQVHIREALAQIPHVLTVDDHDIFDGYGSYPEYMQQSQMFRNVGRIGIDMYLLFQHHTTHEILRNVNTDLDLFTITGAGWHFLKYLGPAVVVVGPDTRSERTLNQVMAGPTYQGLFPKVATLPPSVQHCIWMIPVPIIYPRLHSAQQIANTVTQGKKAVTGTFNMLGKMTSSVAGIVGAKEVVNDGFASVKKAVGKSGLMSGMLNPFGELDVLDELRDMWTHESKDLERTYIIRTLQGISHNKCIRMTFLSGSVNCAGAGLVHDPSHPSDHKTMYQLISSSIVNAPPSAMVLRLLNTDPKSAIFVPPNGKRSVYSSTTPQPATDTKEDMMEIFVADPNGSAREMKRLMGRRNYVAMVAYDPEVVQGSFGPATPGKGSGRLSLAADFLVQSSDGQYGGTVKYGPVVIPSLEWGR